MVCSTYKGAVAVVTGGASGIGFEIASALHERGAHVLLADLDVKALAAKAAELGARPGGGRVATAVVDCTDDKQLEGLLATTLAKFGVVNLVTPSARRSKQLELLARRMPRAHMPMRVRSAALSLTPEAGKPNHRTRVGPCDAPLRTPAARRSGTIRPAAVRSFSDPHRPNICHE